MSKEDVLKKVIEKAIKNGFKDLDKEEKLEINLYLEKDEDYEDEEQFKEITIILLENKFPYDLIASRHDMLAPKRHIEKVSECTEDEIKELNKIYKDATEGDEYNFMIENFNKNRTIPKHYHVHFLKTKSKSLLEKL